MLRAEDPPERKEGAMADDEGVRTRSQEPWPNPALGSLDVMVGTWDLAGRESGPVGEIRGRVTLEWMEGGFFLVQRVDIDYIGRRIAGTQYVGYDEANGILKAYFFSNTGSAPFPGPALEYVWEVGEGGLTIWGGFVGSPAKFEGVFGDDGNTITGRWEWPGADTRRP